MTSVKEEFDIIKEIINDVQYAFGFEGSSMEPTIKEGDIVEIKGVDKFVPQKIYVYYDAYPTERLVCHRLVCIKDNYFYFKGDNRACLDRPITSDMILGEVYNVRKSKEEK